MFARPSWTFKSTICTFFIALLFITQGQNSREKNKNQVKICSFWPQKWTYWIDLILHSVFILTWNKSKLDFPKWAVKSIFGFLGLPNPSKVPFAHFAKLVCSLLKAKCKRKRQESGQKSSFWPQQWTYWIDLILHSVYILTTVISKLDFPKWAVKSIFCLLGLPEPSKVPFAHFS